MSFKTICTLLLSAATLTACSVGDVQLTTSVPACEYEGARYQTGESISVDCNTCICGESGELACTELDCGEDPVGLADPSAVKCGEDGFYFEIREDEDGGEYGVCIDEENNECDSWAYFRGECVLGAQPNAVVEEPVIDVECGMVGDEQISCADEGTICAVVEGKETPECVPENFCDDFCAEGECMLLESWPAQIVCSESAADVDDTTIDSEANNSKEVTEVETANETVDTTTETNN